MLTYFAGIGISWITAVLSFWFNPKTVLWVSYGIINPILFGLPRFVRSLFPPLRARLSASWLQTVETIGAAIILVNAPGSLILHDMGIQYDRFLHYVAGGLVYFLAIPILGAVFVRHPSTERRKLMLIAACVVFVGLFGFETFQWSSDRLFGTELFHDMVQPIERDATEDIIFGTLGMITAGVLMLRARVWSWLTRGVEA